MRHGGRRRQPGTIPVRRTRYADRRTVRRVRPHEMTSIAANERAVPGAAPFFFACVVPVSGKSSIVQDEMKVPCSIVLSPLSTDIWILHSSINLAIIMGIVSRRIGPIRDHRQDTPLCLVLACLCKGRTCDGSDTQTHETQEIDSFHFILLAVYEMGFNGTGDTPSIRTGQRDSSKTATSAPHPCD